MHRIKIAVVGMKTCGISRGFSFGDAFASIKDRSIMQVRTKQQHQKTQNQRGCINERHKQDCTGDRIMSSGNDQGSRHYINVEIKIATNLVHCGAC